MSVKDWPQVLDRPGREKQVQGHTRGQLPLGSPAAAAPPQPPEGSTAPASGQLLQQSGGLGDGGVPSSESRDLLDSL